MKTTADLTLEQPQTAVDALSTATGLSRSRIKDAMVKGACWIQRRGRQTRLRRARKILEAGTRLRLYYDDAILARKPPEAELLADQHGYTVWFKPHHMHTQGTRWGDHCSLLRYAEVSLQRPCWLVHRLDADAAGLVLVAHTRSVASALSALFSGRSMTKVYQARVLGTPEPSQQLLELPLDGKPARTRIRVTGKDEITGTSLLEVLIETGRKHQIRRHLAAIGHPIQGDRIYGRPAPVPLQLVACRLAFTCPLQHRQVEFRVPVSGLLSE